MDAHILPSYSKTANKYFKFPLHYFNFKQGNGKLLNEYSVGCVAVTYCHI